MTYSVDDIIGMRTERIANVSIKNWHSRVDQVDSIYSDDWTVVFPDETQRKERPRVPNVVRSGLDDIARLVSQSAATVRCDTGISQDDKKRAEIRERAAVSYWDFGRGPLLEPRLALDLAGAGAAFLLSYADPKVGRYPKPIRLDPRNCYPDLSRLGHISSPVGEAEGLPETQLSNLIVATRMPIRQIEALYGLDVPVSPNMKSEDGEVIDFYDSEQMTKIVMAVAGDAPGAKPIVVATNPNTLGRLPVAFAQMDTADGNFRGIFDATIGILGTWNRLWTLALDDFDRHIYSQPFYKGLVNPQDIGDPSKALEGNSDDDSEFSYVQPGSVAGAIFPLMEVLERGVHGASGYPLTRAQEPSQSIISAAGVSATQGTLTSHVLNLLRLIAAIRQEWNYCAFAQDQRLLDFEKPLSRPLGRRSTYKPSKDIGEDFSNRVVYGFGAGLDKPNQYVLLEQALGARLIARETVRENMTEIPDPMTEEQKIQRETTEDALFQAVITSGDVGLLAQVLGWQGEGLSMEEIAPKIAEYQKQKQEAEAQAQQQQGAPPEPQPMPGEVAPEAVAAQQTATEKGGTPPPSPFAPPPLTSVIVK